MNLNELRTKHCIVLVLIIVVMTVVSCRQLEPPEEEVEDFTREWVVRVKDRHSAKDIAQEHGYLIKKEIHNFPGTFVFQKLNHHRSRRVSHDLTAHLVSDPRVVWAEQQVIRTRVKRRGIRSRVYYLSDPVRNQAGSIVVHPPQRFNDELWNYQWYLRQTNNRRSISLPDHKIEEVWNMGFTGKGVVVTVVDDGIEYNHTDLKENYDPKASFDANDNDNDAFPRYDAYNTNAHGTKCAGEIAMSPNNRKCGVGIAFNSRIGGIRCLDGPVVDEVEAAALSFNNQYIDIYSASWGPPDDGKTVDGPKRLTQEALMNGAIRGRQGKGVIYVWASGNGGVAGDNCNCDGYVSSIYTLAIGAATQQGKFPWYGERCASVLAAAYSSGTYTEQKVVTTDLHNKCTLEHTGTSAAAPLAAGIIALMLEANNKLTWRDVQHLVVLTSEFSPLHESRGWKRNSAGFLFNSRFGFGLLNAAALVKEAINWTLVPPMVVCYSHTKMHLPITMTTGGSTYVSFYTDGCKGTPNEVNSLEQVQVFVDIDHESRGKLEIYLKSPSGTVSMLLSPRPNDKSTNGFANWHFTSVHFWGEEPRGRWNLLIREKRENKTHKAGKINEATLLLYGTRDIPSHLKKKKVYPDEKLASACLDRFEEYDDQNPHSAIPTDPGQLVSWNDYAYAFIPYISEQKGRIISQIKEKLSSFNLSRQTEKRQQVDD